MKQSGLKVENSTDMDWKQISDILIQQFFSHNLHILIQLKVN